MYRRKAFLAAILLVGCLKSQAQLTNGKVLKATGKSTVSTIITTPQGEMEVPIKGESLVEVTIGTVDNNSVKGTALLKQVKGVVQAMGQEIKYDSKDPATASNPMVKQMLDKLSLPVPFELKNGIPDNKVNISDWVQSNGSDIIFKLMLPTTKLPGIKESDHWSDVLTDDKSGSTATVNYNVSKITDQEIIIDGIAEIKFINNIEQMGIEMKQNLVGTISFNRKYDKKGILLTETSNTNLSGKMDAMGQQMGVKMKGNVTTTIE